jgi:hypothetical protein
VPCDLPMNAEMSDGKIDFEQFLQTVRCILGIVVSEIQTFVNTFKSFQSNRTKNGHGYQLLS